MTSTNAFTQFQSLIPKASRSVVEVLTINGDGTSTVRTLSGATIVVQGGSVSVGNNAYVQDGVITGSAPNINFTEVSI